MHDTTVHVGERIVGVEADGLGIVGDSRIELVLLPVTDRTKYMGRRQSFLVAGSCSAVDVSGATLDADIGGAALGTVVKVIGGGGRHTEGKRHA